MKRAITIVIILAALLVAGFYIYKSNVKKTSEMRGRVTEYENNEITVFGQIRTGKPGQTQNKKVVFKITPNTILKKTVIKLPVSGKGEVAQPPKESAGSIEDLKEGLPISKIISNDNLYQVDETTAVQIEYQILEGGGDSLST